jgi:hypothetical protein
MLNLFLDIDGVLCTNWSHKSPKKKVGWYDENVYPFDPKCVDVLNWILSTWETKIILSSDWRLYYTLEEICDIFKFNKVLQNPIDMTGSYYPHIVNDAVLARNGEIFDYMNSRRILIENNYIILDDMPLHLKNFVKCIENEGLKQCGMKNRIEKTIKKLNL